MERLALKTCSADVQKATVIPASDTYDDYLEMEIPEDAVTEEPVDPYAIDTSPGKPIKVEPDPENTDSQIL